MPICLSLSSSLFLLISGCLSGCLVLFLSLCTFLALLLCLPLPPTLHLPLSALPHLSINMPPQRFAVSLPCLQWRVDQPCSSRRCALLPSLPDWVTVLRSHMCSSDLCESLLLQKVSLLRWHLTCIGRVMIYYISNEFWITSLIPRVTTLHRHCQGKIKPGFRSWEGLRHNCCVVYVRICKIAACWLLPGSLH